MGRVGAPFATEINLGVAVAACVIGSGSVVDWSGEDVVGTLVSGGSPGSSFPSDIAFPFGWKLFIDAQAFTKVPSTEK